MDFVIMGITMSSWIVYDYECICISMYSFHSFVIRIRRITTSIYPFYDTMHTFIHSKSKKQNRTLVALSKHCNSSDLSIIWIDLPTVLSLCIFSIIYVVISFSLHTVIIFSSITKNTSSLSLSLCNTIVMTAIIAPMHNSPSLSEIYINVNYSSECFFQ